MLHFTRPVAFRAALLFSGNGVYDGTEITEGVACLVALSRHKANVTVYAPNRDQAHVINHITGSEMPEKRNILIESARITRGDITDMAKLRADDHDVLFLPGGFGAAKNFCDFAFKGGDMQMQADVAAVLKEFHRSKKYIGLSCISPVIAAKVFGSKEGGPGARLTLGCKGDNWPFAGSIDAASSFGNTLEQCDIDEVCVDEANKIVTVPAYMKGSGTPFEVFESLGKLVDEVVKRL